MEKIIIIFIIINFMFIWILKQDWLSPAGVNIFWNSFFVFFAVFVCGNGLEWSYKGVLWILMSMFLFLIGQSIGGRIGVYIRNYYREIYISNLSYVILVILFIIGMILPLIYIQNYGYTIKDVFQLNKLLEINSAIARDRYIVKEVSTGVAGMIITIVTYFIAVCGGYLFAWANNMRMKIICLLILFPPICSMFITNGKAGVTASALLWISGFIVSYLKCNHNTNIFSIKMIVTLILLGAGLLALFDITMMLRIGEISLISQQIVLDKLQVYAFGHIYAFDYWFSNMQECPYELGANTFMFITNWLGITERQPGVYDFLDGINSNVFTQNRGIISDFGVLGALLFWFGLGIIAGFLYKRVKLKGIMCVGSQIVLCMIYFSILYGFIISPWVYSSYVVTFMILGIALLMIKYIKVGIRGKL